MRTDEETVARRKAMDAVATQIGPKMVDLGFQPHPRSRFNAEMELVPEDGPSVSWEHPLANLRATLRIEHYKLRKEPVVKLVVRSASRATLYGTNDASLKRLSERIERETKEHSVKLKQAEYEQGLKKSLELRAEQLFPDASEIRTYLLRGPMCLVLVVGLNSGKLDAAYDLDSFNLEDLKCTFGSEQPSWLVQEAAKIAKSMPTLK